MEEWPDVAFRKTREHQWTGGMLSELPEIKPDVRLHAAGRGRKLAADVTVFDETDGGLLPDYGLHGIIEGEADLDEMPLLESVFLGGLKAAAAGEIDDGHLFGQTIWVETRADLDLYFIAGDAGNTVKRLLQGVSGIGADASPM
jgi:hypothetical protein